MKEMDGLGKFCKSASFGALNCDLAGANGQCLLVFTLVVTVVTKVESGNSTRAEALDSITVYFVIAGRQERVNSV